MPVSDSKRRERRKFLMNSTYPQPFWLITRYRIGGMVVLRSAPSIGGDIGGETLPVFSSEAEARIFLGGSGVSGDWRVRETGPGELVSMLYCLYANVGRIVLDSLPRPLDDLDDFPSLDREAFIRLALERGRSISTDKGPWTEQTGPASRSLEAPRCSAARTEEFVQRADTSYTSRRSGRLVRPR